MDSVEWAKFRALLVRAQAELAALEAFVEAEQARSPARLLGAVQDRLRFVREELSGVVGEMAEAERKARSRTK